MKIHIEATAKVGFTIEERAWNPSLYHWSRKAQEDAAQMRTELKGRCVETKLKEQAKWMC